MRRRETLVSRVTTYNIQNIQISTNDYKACNETGKYDPFTVELKNSL